MASYRISAGQYEGTLRACGVSLTGRESVDEAIAACRAVCQLGDEPVVVEGGDDEHYVYRDQEDADRDQDGSRAVIVVRRVRS